jgi:hypothetical protein
MLVAILPALLGVALLVPLLWAGADAPGTPRSWLGHRTAPEFMTLAAGFIVATVLLGLLRSRLERVLWASVPDRVSARLLRRVWPDRLAAVLSGTRTTIDQLYGLDVAVAWFRLEPLLVGRVRDMVDRRARALALAARSTATAATVTLVGVALVPLAPGHVSVLLLVPAMATRLSYRAAVRAAAGYGLALRVAFDLQRFDLLAALHLRLPANPADERLCNKRLSASWTGEAPAELPYRHGPVGADVLDRVQDAVKDVLVPPEPVAFRGVVEVMLERAEPIAGRDNRRWQLPVGQRSRLQVALIVGPEGMPRRGRAEQPAEWENPSAIVTEFLSVKGRSAARVQIEIDIDAPFVDVTEPHHHLDLASDEDLGVSSTDMVVSRPGRYDLLVTVFSAGQLVQAVPIELLAVE